MLKCSFKRWSVMITLIENTGFTLSSSGLSLKTDFSSSSPPVSPWRQSPGSPWSQARTPRASSWSPSTSRLPSPRRRSSTRVRQVKRILQLSPSFMFDAAAEIFVFMFVLRKSLFTVTCDLITPCLISCSVTTFFNWKDLNTTEMCLCWCTGTELPPGSLLLNWNSLYNLHLSTAWV